MRLTESNRRLLKRLLDKRNNNNNNSPSPRRGRASGGRRTEKTKYLNSGMRRVYLNTNRNRHFVYTNQGRNRKVRTYTEIFAFKNDWNQIRRIARLRVPTSGRARASPRGRNYRSRY